MVGRKCTAQTQPIAAAEMAGAEDDKLGRKGSAYEYKRVPNLIAEAARAREPRRVWAGSSPYGASAFRNLRSGLPSGTASAKKSSRDLTFRSCARIGNVHPFGNKTSTPGVCHPVIT